jgi:hypothetical protein
VGRGTPRHYKIKRKGRAYWEPTATMKTHGFVSIPLGQHGPDAFKLAEEWNKRWDGTRKGLAPSPAATREENLHPLRAEELTVYPPKSIGAGFKAFRSTNEWARKAPRTREEWFRAWMRIKPVFGDVDPRAVDLTTISAFRQHVEASVSLREAHRCIKIWRALWKVLAAMGYCVRDADPSLGVRNSAAQGRSETWSEGEVVRLAKRAWRLGYRGLASVIAVAWDTQLNPGDVRALTASQMATAGGGQIFFTARGKTGVPVGGALSRRTLVMVAEYIRLLGVELHVRRARRWVRVQPEELAAEVEDAARADAGI